VIEVASWYPLDLEEWNLNSTRPYLELYGETEPYLCTNLAETLPPGSPTNDPETPEATTIYEYFWTIGISQCLYDQLFLLNNKDNEVLRLAETEFSKAGQAVKTIVDKVLQQDELGAEVTLYFPLTGGWRVYEVVSTIGYLRPLPHQENLVDKVAHYWQTVGPVVDSVAGFLRHLPGLASAVSSTLLHSLAKLPITALPPVEGLSWTVHKVTNRVGNEVMDGVQWKLPKKLFEVLGSRVSGSVAVYFHPSWQQQASKVWSSLPVKQRERANESKPIQAKVVVHIPDDQKIPVTERESEIELFIQPKFGKTTL
jgi:hypothetical protein